jgi:uncharacterized protein (UPF0548 family)
MFLLHRPSQLEIDRFIERSASAPLSYAPTGLVRVANPGGNVDECIAVIGRGEAAFERARDALAAWKQFEMPWVELHPRDASLESGTNVAVLVRHLGFWSLNGARIVYGAGSRDHGHRFGFAYGTLTSHAERGEELFQVSYDPASEDVTYQLRAVSWPRAPLARVGYPITRYLQAKFRRDSTTAMRRHTQGST